MLICGKIEDASIDISLEYSNNKPWLSRLFYQQLGDILIRKCDISSKEKRKLLLQQDITCKIKYVGIATSVKEFLTLEKNINMLNR